MFRTPPVRLLLPYYAGPDFGRIPQPQLEPQLAQQALEPGIVPAGLHPHAHLLPGQRTIKLLGLGAVGQPSFFISSRLIVKDRDLLKSRMKITAYNQHDVGSFSESLGLVRSYHRTRRDRANVVMQSSEVRRQPNEVEGPRLSWQHHQPTENFHQRPLALSYPHRECRKLSSGISPQDDVFMVGSRWSATRRNHMEGRASPPDGRARCPSTPKTRRSRAQSAPLPIRSSGAAFRSPDTWSLQTGSRSRDKRPRSRRYQWAARTDRTSSSSQAAGLCDNLDKQNLRGAATSRVLKVPGHAEVLPSNS